MFKDQDAFVKYVQSEIEKDHLKKFNNNSLLVFFLGVLLKTNDYEEIFSSYIIDHNDTKVDDKGLDFFIYDSRTEAVHLGQSYLAQNWTRDSAPSKKATDLNGTLSWLIDADLESISSDTIKYKAIQLRELIEKEKINSINCYYVHNLPNSKNVQKELDTLKANLESKLEGKDIEARCQEIGITHLFNLKKELQENIKITDQIKISTNYPTILIKNDRWKTCIFTMEAKELVQLSNKYGEDFTSGNIRDFIGSRKTSKNINNSIIQTANNEPENFLPFHNGITLLTSKISEITKNSVTIEGVTLINGAQTCGCLSKVEEEKLGKIILPARVIEATSSEIIEKIIKNNNTQNPVKPWELRSIDRIQKRIKEKLEEKGILYITQRGGSRPKTQETVDFEILGKVLCGAYGDPVTAGKNHSEIFENESKYINVFGDDDFSIENYLTFYFLHKRLNSYRASLDQRNSENFSEISKLFNYGTFKYMVLYTIGIIGSLLSGFSQRKLSFNSDILNDKNLLEDSCRKLFDFVMPIIINQMADSNHSTFKNKDELISKSKTIKAMSESILSLDLRSKEKLKNLFKNENS